MLADVPLEAKPILLSTSQGFDVPYVQCAREGKTHTKATLSISIKEKVSAELFRSSPLFSPFYVEQQVVSALKIPKAKRKPG